MKNCLRLLAAIALTLFITAGSAQAQGRIATVDLRKLFDGYWKTKQAQAALKSRADDFQKEGNDLKEKIRKGDEEYRKLLADANDAAVAAEEREKRKKAADAKLKDLRELQEQLTQFNTQASTNLGEQNRRMRENILNEIKTVIASKAKSAGYSMVIDSAAETPNQTSVLIYNSGDNDITEDVLKQLNAGAPVDSKPAEKKEGKK